MRNMQEAIELHLENARRWRPNSCTYHDCGSGRGCGVSLQPGCDVTTIARVPSSALPVYECGSDASKYTLSPGSRR